MAALSALPALIRLATYPVSVAVQALGKASVVTVERRYTCGANFITTGKHVAKRQRIEVGLPLLCIVPCSSAEGDTETGNHRDNPVALSRPKRCFRPRRTPLSARFVEVPTRIVPRHPSCLSRNPQEPVKPGSKPPPQISTDGQFRPSADHRWPVSKAILAH